MSVMQRGESTCPLCCPICPSHSPLPFTSSCAGLAHYPSGNLGRGEIVVILDNLLLKVQDGRAVPSLFCHPGGRNAEVLRFCGERHIVELPRGGMLPWRCADKGGCWAAWRSHEAALGVCVPPLPWLCSSFPRKLELSGWQAVLHSGV